MKCSSWFLCLTFTQVTMSQSGEYADDSILWLSEDGDTALDDAMLFVDELLMGDDSFLLDSALESATELESSRPNGEIGDRQTANSASTKGKTKSRKRPDRRKELEDLRATVSSLESKLSELKQEYRRVDAEDPLSRVWGGIASRQLDERRRTEVENLKLRVMVEDKFRLIRKLEKLLKRPGGDEIALPTKRLRLTTGLSPLESPLVYEDLRQRVDANYAEVDSVFAKPIFDDAAVEPIRIVRLRGDHVNGAIVESVDQVVFPFGYMEVADAAWSLLKTHTLAEPLFSRHLHDVSLSDDTITKELKSVMDGTVYHAKLLCRRFIESNRVVIVTNMLVDPDSIGGKSMDGLYMRAGMWQVIQPASIDRPGRPAAVRRIYHTAVPEMYSLAEESEDSMEQRHRATILTNLVLKSVNTSVDFGNHQLESLLMDRMARLTLQRDDGDRQRAEASLGAALELVDELGLDELCEELSGETIGTVPIVAESPKRGNQEGNNENDAPSSVKKTAKKEKNSGFHQREELGYLRIKVEKLQDQLAALQYAKVAKQLRRASSSPDDVGDGEDAREELVWKDIAARQNQQRQLSEAENARLRGMLEQQIHVAQILERLLKKRTNVELFPPLPSKRVRMSTPLDNPDLYDELDEDTLALYQSLNEVIASRFPDGETTFRDVDVKNDAITGTSLEAMDIRVVPFDYLMTATASWHRFTVGSDLARQFVLEEVKLTEDRVSIDFKGALHPDIPSELHGRIVMCQFVETDHIVIVWSALINPLKVSNTPLDGVVMRYKGVQVMEELPSIPSVTQMRSLHMVIP